MPTALIFGTSRGLGRALVEEHLERGWAVIATVRNRAALADMRSDALAVEVLDNTDWAAVDALRAKLEGRALDRLFVNAGIAGPMEKPIGDVAADEFTEVMLTNALAPLRIADRFADVVAPTGTIAVMSSTLGSIERNDSGGYEAYRMSKAALDMGLRSLAMRRRGRQTFLAVCPGWVKTDMGGPGATLTIGESIPSLVDMLERRQGAGGMAFVNHADEIVPW